MPSSLGASAYRLLTLEFPSSLEIFDFRHCGLTFVPPYWDSRLDDLWTRLTSGHATDHGPQTHFKSLLLPEYWSRLCEQKNIFFDMRRLVQRTYVETETNATYEIGPNTNRKNRCLAVVDAEPKNYIEIDVKVIYHL